MHHKNTVKEMASKADLSAAIDIVIAEAQTMSRQTEVPKSKFARTKNIRENRHFEKERNRKDEAFSLSEDSSVSPPAPVPQEKPAAISPILDVIKQQLEERMNEK